MAKNAIIKLTGEEALARLLAQASGNVARVVGQALTEEMRLVLRESLKQVPVKDAFLKASAEIKPPKFSTGMLKVTAGYGGAAAAYALYVHNSPYEKNWTKAGTKSHFLSDPLAAAVPHISNTLHQRIGRIMGRGSL